METFFKLIFLFCISAIVIGVLTANTGDGFEIGAKQLEQQGYTNIQNTGNDWFCCADDDYVSTGFECRNSKGEIVKGCICSGVGKGVTIRFQ